MFILFIVLKDSLRTYFKSLSLSWSLGARSLSLSWSLGVRSLSLSWSLGVRSLSLSWSLGVRSLLTSLVFTAAKDLAIPYTLAIILPFDGDLALSLRGRNKSFTDQIL